MWTLANRVRDLALIAATAVGGPAGAQAERVTPAQGPPGGSCENYTAEYALSARIRLEDTPFGAGNGVYDVGPGRMRLRFYAPARPGAPGRVELLEYAMKESFVVKSRVLFFTAKVATRADTRATPGADGVAAIGAFNGRELEWSTPVQGYRTDGTIDCEGSGCGMSGAPPSGTSPLHIGPGPVRWSKLVFDADLGTFAMAFTRVSHTDMPKQTAFITFAGRRMKRDCANP